MSYEPYLIANFATGLENDLQPWLIPDDAQSALYDCYIHHGVITKRDGYNFIANGLKNSYPYCESRMVKTSTLTPSSGAINDINKEYTFDTSAITDIIRRGGIRITGSSPSQLIEDDGSGGTKAGSDGTIDTPATIDYLSIGSSIVVTFTTAPATGSSVTLELDSHMLNPVMMVANYTNSSNVVEMLVADTKQVNKYNVTSNRLDDITVNEHTGSNKDFFTWTQYPTIQDFPRLLFTNNVDQIEFYNGTTLGKFFPTFTSTTISSEAYGSGDGSAGPYTHTAASFPIAPQSVTIVADGSQTVTDDGRGNLFGDGTGTINYATGEMSVTFNSVVILGNSILLDYEKSTGYVTTCSKMLSYKGRLILLRTTENSGQVYPQRIRISGFGQSGDDFRTSAIGAGVIDIPSPYWIRGAAFNRDDVMIFTDKETWILKYTGSDIVPFTLDKIDSSRGNKASFAPISYLNLTKAYSPIGFTVSDGYQVQRYDNKIPDYAFEEIDPENFELCFSGTVDDDQNHYLIHPSPGQSQSDRILVNNYEENNFAVFRIALSCMGTFFEGYDVTWNDLTSTNGFNDWNDFASQYGSWNEISFSKDEPITIGGGHKGEIWRMGNKEGEDNPLRIWGITNVSSSPLFLDIDIDGHNYNDGDYVTFSGIGGSEEINGKIAQITDASNHNQIRVKFPSENPRSITAFTSGGRVSRIIPFEFVTKNFNPYSNTGQKVRCGWVYFYLNTLGTSSTDRDGNQNPATLNLEVFANSNYPGNPTQVTQLAFPYKSNASPYDGRTSLKVWRKLFINQNAEMLQFRIYNNQPGTQIRIHALQFGFMPGGRLI